MAATKSPKILDFTLNWGVEFVIRIEDLDDTLTLRGYISEVKFYDQIEHVPFARVHVLSCKEKSIEEAFHIKPNDDPFVWDFPIHNTQHSVDELSKALVDSSGFLSKITFMPFKTKDEMYSWAIEDIHEGEE